MSRPYREHPPPARLEAWVQCLWTSESTAAVPVQRVLPDGCVDILFEAPMGGAGNGEVYVVGMMTRPLLVTTAMPNSFTAVRFKPGAASAFFREPLHRLTDARVDLHDLWPRSDSLRDRLAEAPAGRQRLDLLVAELERRLDGAAPRSHPGCRFAVAKLAMAPETGVHELCAQLGVSRQGLAKSFREHVGVPPKTLGRVLRLQRALRMLWSAAAEPSPGSPGSPASPGSSGLPRPPHLLRPSRTLQPLSTLRPLRPLKLVDVALAAGYYDQSHLIADFKELVGLTPSAYLAESGLGFPFFQDSDSGRR